MRKTWLITGAGKGIGYATAKAVLESGDCVVAVTRKENAFEIPNGYEDYVLNIALDITNLNESAYQAVVERAVERFGGIDVLVNNAGHGRITNFEETSEENIREIFEVNFFGTLRVTRAVLPQMRKQRSGHIINIASAAGYGAGPVAYHSSKFAVTGFSTCLAFEVEPFGIKVTNVAPGLFRTGFYDKGALCTDPDIHIEDYDTVRWQNAFLKDNSNHEQPGDPEKLARLLIDVVNSEAPPLHLGIGLDGVRTIESYYQKLKEDTELWKEKAEDCVFK